MIGALGKLEAIWSVSDTLNGLMAIPNLIAIIALGGVVAKRTKEFLAQRVNGNRTTGYRTQNQ
jgi:AGCS family alanine or glycine:cation symporter